MRSRALQSGLANRRRRQSLAWKLADPPQAYSRSLLWNDGKVIQQGSLERPQLLIQDEHPAHLICATADGPGGYAAATRT